MIHVTINLPGAILPMERGERFEEPLMDAFEAEGSTPSGSAGAPPWMRLTAAR